MTGIYTDGFREFCAVFWEHPDRPGCYQFLDRSGSVVTWPQEAFERRFRRADPEETRV